MKTNPHDAAMDDLDIRREHRFSGASRIILLSTLLFVVLGIWAYFGKLDEVSTGSGKVIPSSREQVLQSLDGGILAELTVREGDKVQANQIVARLDPTRSESNVGESAARYRASLASSARLNAEVNDLPLVFPDSLRAWPDLIASETRLYKSRRAQLADSMAELQDALISVNKELAITQRLEKSGAASHVEVLRLQRQKSDLGLKITDLRSQYFVQAREALSKANAEVDMLAAILKGREDSVTRLTVRAPMRGIVKNIQVTTIGGVIPITPPMVMISVPGCRFARKSWRSACCCLALRDCRNIMPNIMTTITIRIAYSKAKLLEGGALYGTVRPEHRVYASLLTSS